MLLDCLPRLPGFVSVAPDYMSSPQTTARRSRLPGLRLQEGGLLIVIMIHGLLLTLFGGSVKVPQLETNAQGERVRVFRTNAAGEREPQFVSKNKFLNAQNLAQLAKDTSFIAIMAVGMTVVIVSGGIDLSVGAIYALASVLGALVFHRFGPEGSASTGAGAWLGVVCCLGSGLIGGLVNGGMIVALKVHPFIITLGTMAVFRGVAFVVTNGQSVGGFPEVFDVDGDGGAIPIYFLGSGTGQEGEGTGGAILC